MNLPVSIVDAPAETPFSCTGEDPYQGQNSSPCTGATSSTESRVVVADHVTIWPSTGGEGGWAPVIEIDPGRMLARVCTAPFTDVVDHRCPSAFNEARVVCAVSGTVELSGMPGPGVTGYVDAAFDGFTLTGAFAAEG
jgi:hypothetical protein